MIHCDKDLPYRAEADRPIGPMHDRLPVSVKPAGGSKASILSNERVLVGNWELGLESGAHPMSETEKTLKVVGHVDSGSGAEGFGERERPVYTL